MVTTNEFSLYKANESKLLFDQHQSNDQVSVACRIVVLFECQVIAAMRSSSCLSTTGRLFVLVLRVFVGKARVRKAKFVPLPRGVCLTVSD
jgi:hypothetical protein